MRDESMRDGAPGEARRGVLRAIEDWTDRGWLRRLDAAFARFVAEMSPSADGIVLLLAALVAHLEGRGHTCLVLEDPLVDPGDALRWPDDAGSALVQRMATLPASAAEWAAALARCDAVEVDTTTRSDPSDTVRGGEPLVLSGERLYLRRYWRYERRVAADVRRRLDVADADEAVDVPSIRRGLDRLMPSTSQDDGPHWQKIACAIALRGRLSIVTGGPGTGKTFTAARLLALLHATSERPDTLRIALAAPTGKAAARLQQSIADAFATLRAEAAGPSTSAAFASRIGPARTLHALLGARPRRSRDARRFRHDAAHPLPVDVVIVDEASMIHVEMMDALLDALPRSARIVLLGDKDQLASVEAGAVLGELCRGADRARYTCATAAYIEATTGERVPSTGATDVDASGSTLAQQTVVLRRSRRFTSAIGALAAVVNGGDADAARGLLDGAGDGVVAQRVPATPQDVVDIAVDGRPGAPGGHGRYLDLLRIGPIGDEAGWTRRVLDAFDTFRVLCAVRQGAWGVEELNRAIRRRLVDDGRLVGSRASDGEWYEGRPVIVKRNDAALGVHNGDIGIALRSARHASTLRVHFVDGDTLRSVGVGHLGHVETAFAMTVHQSQGSEFDHTLLVLPPERNVVTTRELVYTGITRARSAFTLISENEAVLAESIAQTTRRSSGLMRFIEER